MSTRTRWDGYVLERLDVLFLKGFGFSSVGNGSHRYFSVGDWRVPLLNLKMMYLHMRNILGK